MSQENSGHYQENYARRYIEKTLNSPYTKYKNRILSLMAKNLGARQVLDLGCNVNPLVKINSSLRSQMEEQGVEYIGMDLSFPYFDKKLASELNLPPDEIYESRTGIVGDMHNIPMRDSSAELITCVDVLEHLSNPEIALQEISRILTEQGKALIVIPSMYKLDVGDFPYIDARRQSSHESKLTLSTWIEKFEKASLQIDHQLSRPLGVASGLSYLSWLAEDFVPERHNLNAEEIYSDKSNKHKRAKGVISKYDPEIDGILLSNLDYKQKIISSMQSGDIKGIFVTLSEIIGSLGISADEQKLWDDFCGNVLREDFDKERIKVFTDIFKKHENPLILMGNSILLVLRKKP